jgi:hypothetical protein
MMIVQPMIAAAESEPVHWRYGSFADTISISMFGGRIARAAGSRSMSAMQPAMRVPIFIAGPIR